MKATKIPAIALGLSLAACLPAEPTIDATSEEKMQQSIQRIGSKLSDDKKRQDFEAAVAMLAFSEIAAALKGDAAPGIDSIRKRLDGKTVDEVLAMAVAETEARKRREREQALSEIAELRAKLVEAEKAKAILARFEVTRSRFYKRKDVLGEEPIVELTVKNGTDRAVARAHFEGILASPGRSIPWVKESFNYQIPGGLEPGETATWRLAPNRFSKWGTTQVPPDAVLTVTVQRLDGPSESTVEFSETDRRRLEELTKRLER